jgi:ATP-dependent DNA helicase RecQ
MPAESNSSMYRDFAAYNHAGMPQERRTKVHEDFLLDRVRVVVATVAFGMGIDKKNVRAVVHWGMPKSMEEWAPARPPAARSNSSLNSLFFIRVRY